MHGWAEVEHDLVYKPLSGDLSDAEYDILDGLNGLVLASEIALRRLQVAFDQRVNQANEAFTNHYELAAFLHRELKLAARDAPEPDMGRVDLLFQLLRRYEKNQPGAIRPLLSRVVTDPETECPIGEQLIDLFIGNSAWIATRAMKRSARLTSATLPIALARTRAPSARSALS
jgi:hypothetical protein